MSRKHFPLSAAVCLTLLAGILAPVHSARAQDAGTPVYVLAGADDYNHDRRHWMLFHENQEREPCQYYLAPPAGFVEKHCQVYRVEIQQAAVVTPLLPAPAAAPLPALLPIVASYTVNFNWNKSNIRPDAENTLARVSQEIDKYHPQQVTVSGYTDTSGSAGYNQKLSERRAQTVARALTALGVTNQVIDKEAYGETSLAVPTGDGVKLEANRRVVIDFRHQQ